MKVVKSLPFLNMSVANVTKKLREKQGLTQEQLASVSSLSVGYIGQLECGVRGASLSVCLELAEAFGLTAPQFIGRVVREQKRLMKIHVDETLSQDSR